MDYLIKPFEEDRIHQTIERAVLMHNVHGENGSNTQTQTSERRRYIVCYKPHRSKERILMEASSVYYVQARHGVIYIYSQNDKEPLVTDWPMKDLLEQLADFMRKGH